MTKKPTAAHVARSIAEIFTDCGDGSSEEVETLLNEVAFTGAELDELGLALKKEIETDVGWQISDVRTLRDAFKKRGVKFPKVEI